jgi:hypothetical protein
MGPYKGHLFETSVVILAYLQQKTIIYLEKISTDLILNKNDYFSQLPPLRIASLFDSPQEESGHSWVDRFALRLSPRGEWTW